MGDGIFWTIWVLVERVLVGNGPKCPLSEQSDLQPVRRTINETLWSSVSYSVKRAHVLFCLNDALFAALCLEQAWFAKACWCVSLGRKDFWQVRRWMQQGKSVSRTFTSQRPNAAHEDSFLSHRWSVQRFSQASGSSGLWLTRCTHTYTHIYLLLVYRSDWIRFIYIIIDKQKHIMAYHSQKYQKYCAPISGLMPFARTSRWNFKTFSVVMSLQSGFLCYHLFSVSNCSALSAISFKSLIVLFLAGTRCWGLLKPGESPKSWVGPMGPMRTSSRLPQVSAFALAKEHMRQRMGQWSVPSMLASTCLDMSQPHFV